MKTNKLWRILSLLAFVLAGCSSVDPKTDYPVAQESYPFIIKITDFYGAYGFGQDYYIQEDAVVVVRWNDFGYPPKEVYRRILSREEIAEWKRTLSEFPLSSLKTEYDNPLVSDGLQQWFVFKDGNVEKAIMVRNQYVPELFELCRQVNQTLPNELKMHVPEQPTKPIAE